MVEEIHEQTILGKMISYPPHVFQILGKVENFFQRQKFNFRWRKCPIKHQKLEDMLLLIHGKVHILHLENKCNQAP